MDILMLYITKNGHMLSYILLQLYDYNYIIIVIVY